MVDDERSPPPLVLGIILVFSIFSVLSVGLTLLLNLPIFFIEFEFWNLILGVTILCIGFPMMGLTFRELRVHRALGNEIYKSGSESSLVTTGIYAHTRNPLYLSSVILFIGWVFVSRLTPLIIMTFLFIFLFVFVAKWEENELTERFGQPYLEYRAKVPFFVPYPKRRTDKK